MRKFIVVLALVFTTVPLSSAWSNNNLIIGENAGFFSNGGWEIRNSSGGAVSNGTLWAARSAHCAVKLNNGNVFVAGGAISSGTWEIRTSSGAFVSSGNLWASRGGPTCNKLQNGNIIIIGGQGSAETSTWEIRTATGTLVSHSTLNAIRNDHMSNILANGNVMIIEALIHQGRGRSEMPAEGLLPAELLGQLGRLTVRQTYRMAM